jgi:hypothetical protein
MQLKYDYATKPATELLNGFMRFGQLSLINGRFQPEMTQFGINQLTFHLF